ncbi:MAG: sodium/substrate symporter small subunit [Rubrivivax sp.]
MFRGPTAVWRTTRWLTAALLAVWLSTTLAVVWFARDLQSFSVLGFPAGYWGAAAGALLVYLSIVLVYAWLMDRIEHRPRAEPDSATSVDSR